MRVTHYLMGCLFCVSHDLATDLESLAVLLVLLSALLG